MNSLIALCTDYYWEQDAQCRFTLIRRLEPDCGLDAEAIETAIGMAPWDIEDLAPATDSWGTLRDIIEKRHPFRKNEWRWLGRAAQSRWLSVSGEPVFDSHGSFLGYRGVMQDVTAQRQEQERLVRFRTAMDVCSDPIVLVDRETMQFIDANAMACNATGYSYDELLAMGPYGVLSGDRESLEREYDQTIASGKHGINQETLVRNKDGSSSLYELRRRAFRFDNRWIIVTVARDITRRKRAEEAAVRLGRMYAAISGTNEAILHARDSAELYQKVCDVAVREGTIASASVLLRDGDSEWARPVAVAGIGAQTLRTVRISFDDARPEGQGLAGTAYRSRKACVINDFMSEPRLRPWREAHAKEGVYAGAAFPIVRNDRSVGVLLMYSRETDAFDEDIVQLLERMAQNIAFALDNFDRDVERQRAVEALRASEEKYRGILEHMVEGYFEIDLKGSYTFVNDAMCRMHRCSRQEALRLNYREYASPETAAYMFKVYNQVYRTGEAADLAEYATFRQDGTVCIAQTSVQLVLNTNGEPVGFRGICRDVTALRQAEEALRSSEEKYRSILENIEEAYYEVDLRGNLLHCNDAFCRMFGYSVNEVIGLNYRDFHRQEDIPFVYTTFNEVYRTGIPKKGSDWRMPHKDGQVLLCEGSIHLVRNGAGDPVGFRGMLRDVTARRAMEAALRESEERFRDLTELSSDWYWEQDRQHRFVQINGDVLRRTGLAADDYLGKTLWELPFDTLSVDQWHEHRKKVEEGMPFYELVLKTSSIERQPRYISISGLPIKDRAGGLTGYRGTGKDITERKEAEERIRHLANHDILTGLPNRMMFNQVLSFQLQQARRYDRRFALMFIDLDHFKAVNDDFGHDAGDVLLKTIAMRLAASVRSSDFVARLAGDEFVVIIQEPGDMSQLKSVAEKIVSAVRAPVELAGTACRVTASVGVCLYPDDGQDEESLLKRADAAMYRVKRSSKDSFRLDCEDR